MSATRNAHGAPRQQRPAQLADGCAAPVVPTSTRSCASRIYRDDCWLPFVLRLRSDLRRSVDGHIGVAGRRPLRRQSAGAIGPEDSRDPLEHARTALESLINRLRRGDLPDGITKSNGRVEATAVDVSAKYPGRLATLTVDEGDEVTAGQVVATISSPETEAQLRGAQAQVLKSKHALAEANAQIAQRKSDLDFARTDYDRGKKPT